MASSLNIVTYLFIYLFVARIAGGISGASIFVYGGNNSGEENSQRVITFRCSAAETKTLGA